MESDGEIEYLDEDAEIVQQCVQKVSVTATPNEDMEEQNVGQSPLLVERQPAKKKKRKVEEDDSDYDPRDDIPIPFNRHKKKKPIPVRNTAKSSSSQTLQMLRLGTSKVVPAFVSLKNRKKMNIRIPDYEDPLCLPVKAIQRDDLDLKKLKAWNSACLSHLRHSDKLLKPEKGITKGSSRTVVLKNVHNRETGKYETAVWARTCVENEMGLKKSQNFQSILPKFAERKVLDISMVFKKPNKRYHHVDEVILTKETNKNEETLVAYKPKESLSAVYKMIEQDKVPEDLPSSEKKKCLREVACCKLCAACYQVSWRGARAADERKHIRCAICSRTFVSVYNLLTHVRSHSSDDVRKHKRQLAATLAKMVGYHYRCRICQENFLSIAKLREHVMGHKGTEMFVCEIGNHMTS